MALRGRDGQVLHDVLDALARMDFGPEPLKASVFDDGPADRSGARGRTRRAAARRPSDRAPGAGRCQKPPLADGDRRARAPLRERSPSLQQRPTGLPARGSGLYGSPSSHGRRSGADRARRQSSLSGWAAPAAASSNGSGEAGGDAEAVVDGPGDQRDQVDRRAPQDGAARLSARLRGAVAEGWGSYLVSWKSIHSLARPRPRPVLLHRASARSPTACS